MTMATVQKTVLVAFSNEKLLRSDDVTDIIDEINHVLRDLSKAAKWPCLYRSNESEDQVTLASGISSTNMPDNFRVLDFIIINDGSNDGKPLKEITFERWLKYREDESSNNYNEPKKFARRGRKIFWHPIPDGSYTVKFYGWRTHPKTSSDTEDIVFTDDFEEVMKYGTCAEIAKTHKQTENIAIWEPRYESEKAKMIPEEDFKTTLVAYQD